MINIASSRTRFGASIIAMLAAMMPATAWSQSETASDAQDGEASRGGVNVIIVTAQKRSQGANDVGITLNAFNGDQLDNMGVTSAADIALYTPGLTVTEALGNGVPNYTIRGVGFQDYSTNSSSTVGLYFDEVAVPYTVMSRGAIFDLERVEVLKGPQGDLYGRNTTGGQINYISASPKSTPEGQFRVSAGSFETVSAEGFITGPLSNTVNARLAYSTTQSGKGWQRSLTRPGDRLGKLNTIAVRGLLDINLGDANLVLRGQYVRDKSENTAPTAYDGRDAGLNEFALPYAQIFPFLISGARPPWYSIGDNQAADWTNSFTDSIGRTFGRPKRDNELFSTSAKFAWDISPDIELVSITAYDKFKRNELFDADGIAGVDTGLTGKTDIDVFSQELRFSGQIGALDWLVGGYYSRDTIEESSLQIFAESFFGQGGVLFDVFPFNAAPLESIETRYRQVTESKAVFTHLEYEAAEGLRFTVGGRYTDETRSWTGCTYDSGDGSLAAFNNLLYGTTQAAGDCGTLNDDPTSPNFFGNLLGTANANSAFLPFSSQIAAKKWNYRVGVDYRLAPGSLLYANVAHGFKSGGFNGAAAQARSQLQPYMPETLTSYEVGLKSTLFDNKMQLNIAGFYYDYRNKQEASIAVTAVGNITGLTNVPKSRIYGVDVEANVVPIDGLNIFFGSEYLNAEVTEWQAISSDSLFPTVITVDASGQRLAQSPKWQFNGGVDYTFAIADGLKLTTGFDANYKSDTSGGVYPQNATDAYVIVNARIALADQDDRWELSIWSRNLFDEYYFPAAYFANGPLVRTNGMPRTIGLTGQFNF